MKRQYATKDPRRGELYSGEMDDRTGLEIIAKGDRVTLEASRNAVRQWCEKRGFMLMREMHDKRTDRTFLFTSANRFFIHDNKRNMLLSD